MQCILHSVNQRVDSSLLGRGPCIRKVGKVPFPVFRIGLSMGGIYALRLGLSQTNKMRSRHFIRLYPLPCFPHLSMR